MYLHHLKFNVCENVLVSLLNASSSFWRVWYYKGSFNLVTKLTTVLASSSALNTPSHLSPNNGVSLALPLIMPLPTALFTLCRWYPSHPKAPSVALCHQVLSSLCPPYTEVGVQLKNVVHGNIPRMSSMKVTHSFLLTLNKLESRLGFTWKQNYDLQSANAYIPVFSSISGIPVCTVLASQPSKYPSLLCSPHRAPPSPPNLYYPCPFYPLN